MTLQAQLWLPFANLPYDGLLVPTSRNDVGTFRGDVKGANVVGMPDKETLGIVARGSVWLLDFNYRIFATRNDQAIGVFAVWREVCDRVDELGTICNNRAFV